VVPVLNVSVPDVKLSLVSERRNCKESKESKVSALPTESELVGCHAVEVPVDVKTCPAPPDDPEASLKAPEIVVVP
jgi:hypothetical protein